MYNSRTLHGIRQGVWDRCRYLFCRFREGRFSNRRSPLLRLLFNSTSQIISYRPTHNNNSTTGTTPFLPDPEGEDDRTTVVKGKP